MISIASVVTLSPRDYDAVLFDLDSGLCQNSPQQGVGTIVTSLGILMYAAAAELRERFVNGADSLGGWKPNPAVRTQRI